MKREKRPKRKKIEVRKAYHPGSVESMLSDYAKEGWLLQRISGDIFYFIQTDSVDMEYRIVCTEGIFKEEQLTRYGETGWASMQWGTDRLILYAKASYGPREQYYTKEEEELWKTNRFSTAMFALIASFAAILLILYGFFRFGDAGLELRFRVIMMCFFQVLVLCPLIIRGVGEGLRLYRQRLYTKEVAEYGWSAHHRSWRTSARRRKVIRTIAIVIFSGIAFIYFLQLIDRITGEADKKVSEIPFIKLEDLSERVQADQVEDEEESEDAWNNIAFLAYREYTYTDWGSLRPGVSAHLYEEYYEVPGLVVFNKNFLRSLVLEDVYFPIFNKDQTGILTMSVDGLDYVCYLPKTDDDDVGCTIAASKGNKALYVKVSGVCNETELAELIKQKLSE